MKNTPQFIFNFQEDIDETDFEDILHQLLLHLCMN